MNIFKKIWRWIRLDGLLHIIVSCILFIGSLLVFRNWIQMDYTASWVLAFVITVAIGVLKETYDYIRKKVASTHDLICNLIGVALAMIIMAIIL